MVLFPAVLDEGAIAGCDGFTSPQSVLLPKGGASSLIVVRIDDQLRWTDQAMTGLARTRPPASDPLIAELADVFRTQAEEVAQASQPLPLSVGREDQRDLPPSEWSKIIVVLDHEGDWECHRRSTSERRSLAVSGSSSASASPLSSRLISFQK